MSGSYGSCSRVEFGGGTTPARLIAFYLPQFHPTPENNMWWGRGFTEWTNVAKTRPRFDGHYQPHVPADLGFYDLRMAEARHAQALLAQKYGIHGFCYYHYWFNGRRLLSLPLDELLNTGKPDFPFCLCWANEDWTRAWDGNEKSILIKQEYSDADDRSHMEWLASVFKDPRYIRVNGKPLFLVYRVNHLPSAKRTAEVWRETARKMGVGEIFLCRVESFPDERGDPIEFGFDAAVEFQPDWGNLGDPLTVLEENQQKIFDYASFVQRQIEKSAPSYPRFPCVTPSWDNSARRLAGAVTFSHPDPQAYSEWLATAVARVSPHPEAERIVFINAWNEWAEGNHLEPDLRFGHAYLQATLDAISGKLRPSHIAKRIIKNHVPLAKRLALLVSARTARPSDQSQLEARAIDTQIEETGGALAGITNDLNQRIQQAYGPANWADELVLAEQKLLIAEERISQLEDEIARIRSTISWNITKPLRTVFNLLNGKLLRQWKQSILRTRNEK